MKRFLLFSLLFCLAGTAFAQDTSAVAASNYIPILCYWNLGDKFDYKGIKENKNYDANGLLQDSTSQEFDLSLLVVDSTASGYVIRVIQDLDWEQLNQTLTKSGIDESEFKAILKKQKCQNLEYLIDPNGVFLSMKNLDAFVESVKQVVYALIDSKLKSKKENEAAKQFQANLLSPAVVQNQFISEFINLHKFYGYEFALDSIHVFDDEIPNSFLPGETLIRHNRLSARIMPEGWDGLVTVQDSMKIDGEDAKALLRGYFGARAGAELEDYFRKNSIYYTYNIDLTLYQETGVIYAMTYERSTYINNKLANFYSYFMLLQEE